MPRQPLPALPLLLASVVTAGCMAPAPHAAVNGRTASVTLRATIAPPPARQLAVTPAALKWTPSDVCYVTFQVFAGSDPVPYLTQHVDGADIRTAGTTLTFTSLAANTTYRIEARAYEDPDGPDYGVAGTLISRDLATDTGWRTTVAVTNDNAPTAASPITLQLIDRLFDGTTTVPRSDLDVSAGFCTFDPQGVVSTVVGGDAAPAFVHGGTALDTSITGAGQMVCASDGTLYVIGGHRVWMVTRDRETFLLGGFASPHAGVGCKGQTGFDQPRGLALSKDETKLFVADFNNGRVVRIDLSSADLKSAMPAIPDAVCLSDPNYASVVAGGVAASPPNTDGNRLTASLNGPTGLAISFDGSLLVTDYLGFTVRRIDLNSSAPDTDPSYVTTVAGGKGVSASLDNSTSAVDGRFKAPYDIERFQDGFLIADHGTPALRKLTLKPTGQWGLTTFATQATFAGDAAGDTLWKPQQLAVDHADRIWFQDRDEAAAPAALRLRCLDPSKSGDARLRSWLRNVEDQFVPYKDGHIDDATFAWAGIAPFPPLGVCVDRSGTVYFGDPTANSVRKLQ